MFAIKGCTQDGWSRTDMGEKSFDVEQLYEGNEDLMLYPHWSCNTYDITYEMFGVDAVNYINPKTGEIHNPMQYTGPAALTLKNAYDPDNKFFMSDWYKEPTFKTTIRTIQDIKDPITVYARWYNKITYKPGSNVSGAKNLEEKKYFDNTYTFKSSIDKYVRANYTLDGWSLTDGGEKVYGLGDAYTTNANLTLYPHWTANTHTITYNNVETSELPEGYPETYTHEASVTLPVPTRNGYEFLGWFVDGEFNGDAVTEIPEGQTEDKEFFAKWSDAVEYTATYNLNGGSMDGEESFTFTIESNDIDLATPTKNGYTFVGWFDGVTSDVVTVLPTGSFGDRTLTAQWSDPIEYTITYENVNGAANENATSYTIEQSVVLNNLEKDGFVFVGWFDNAEFEGNAATEIPQGTTGEKTFYAKWLEVFSITYAPGEGDGITGAVAAGTKTATEDATLSNDGFTREGYTQTGWKIEDGSVTYAMGATYTTDASVTLYPIWEAEVYHVYYHNIEGATFETPNPETYTVEDEFPIVLNEPTKVGFNFLGWFLSEDAEEPKAGIAAGSTGEANFYARWELAPSPITVTASSGSFEYDGETHNATCSYEGVIPVGYSIALVPSGSVQNVSEGKVVTSCEVTIKDESGNDVTALFTELTVVDGTISVVAKTVNYGGIAVITDETGTRAEIDDDAMTPINITNDVEVDHVTFNRNFPLVKYATVMLPFSIDTNKVHGAEFYSVVMMKLAGKWVAGASLVKTTQLVANTPYLLFAKEQNLTFDGPVTLNTSVMHDSTTVVENEGCQWTFKGTYEKLVWEAGHSDLGKIFAFSAHDVSDEIKVGKFVKFGADSWIRPMRAYLVYEQLPSSDPEPDPAPAPAMYARAFKTTPSTASIDNSDVPEWIDVVIIDDENEQTTPIAQMNSRTGEVRMMDGWFDMNGRKLNGKPTAKGIYYNNGKRVIVK